MNLMSLTNLDTIGSIALGFVGAADIRLLGALVDVHTVNDYLRHVVTDDTESGFNGHVLEGRLIAFHAERVS